MIKTSGLKQILGKTITGVVVKESHNTMGMGPYFQLHLVFLDGTVLEMWSSGMPNEKFYFGEFVDQGGMDIVRADGCEYMNIVYEAFIDENGQVIESHRSQSSKVS